MWLFFKELSVSVTLIKLSYSHCLCTVTKPTQNQIGQFTYLLLFFRGLLYISKHLRILVEHFKVHQSCAKIKWFNFISAKVDLRPQSSVFVLCLNLFLFSHRGFPLRARSDKLCDFNSAFALPPLNGMFYNATHTFGRFVWFYFILRDSVYSTACHNVLLLLWVRTWYSWLSISLYFGPFSFYCQFSLLCFLLLMLPGCGRQSES